jgi:peptidyl-tRNA hydrolase, PTH1 family
MKLVVGLGNPGDKYTNNRHNVGFLILDEFAKTHGLTWNDDKKFNAVFCRQGDNFLLKPQTFMNNSGEAVSAFANFYKILPEDILVIHDDVDLEFGRTKKALGASSAGHHGVESIIEKLGTKEFWRLRFGVGKPTDKSIKVEDWVLMSLSEIEINNVTEFGHTLTF